MRGRGARSGRIGVAVAVGVGLLLAGCSGDDTADPPSTTTRPASTSTAPDDTVAVVDTAKLEFRPVLEVAAPPCAAGTIEDRAGELCYRLGGVALDERAVESAQAVLDQTGTTWQVALVFRDGPDGIDRFNAATTGCFNADPSCPTQQLAILLDGVVESAPSIQTPTFERDAIVISGDFTEDDAQELADALSA